MALNVKKVENKSAEAREIFVVVLVR